jgi:hypothetical protein
VLKIAVQTTADDIMAKPAELFEYANYIGKKLLKEHSFLNRLSREKPVAIRIVMHL